MAEKLINGTFTGNLSGWSNIGSSSFVRTLGNRARGTSSGAPAREYVLRQSFAKYGQTLSAVISADIWFYATAGVDSDGYNNFRIELDIPGGGTVILYEAGYNDQIGSDTALVDADISAHLVNNGTYYIRLILTNKASITDGLVDTASYGEYDNISILVTEKLSASASDILGSGEAPQKKSSIMKSAVAGLKELWSFIGGGGTMAKVERSRLIESVLKKAKKTVSNPFRLLESLARSYGYAHYDIQANVAGLVESMSAKVVAGNVTRVVTEFSPATQWSEIAPAATSWEQER
jgi:hypothetical protein